jgi:hypothetical protein
MFDSGGPESYSPDEGGEGGTGNVSEGISEQAKEQFAASQAAMQQIRKEEKKARKRDDGVAQLILQFLTDAQRTHLATLIARLVSVNCPSPFILAILSLINDGCKSVIEEYLKEKQIAIDTSAAHDTSVIPTTGLSAESNEQMVEWIMRMEVVLSTDVDNILNALIVDDSNIDGTVLQLTTFVLQTFLTEHKKNAAFENLQQLSINVLQSLFTPYMQARMDRRLAEQEGEKNAEDDE